MAAPGPSDYRIWLCDRQGTKLLALYGSGAGSAGFQEMTWAHLLNQPAPYAATFAETGVRDNFYVDYGVLIERNWGAGWEEEYYGFHLDEEEWIDSDQVNAHFFRSAGLSPEWILDQPLLMPLANQNPNWDRYDLWWAYEPADDAVKRMAAESCGGGVAESEDERAFDYFMTEGNWGAGRVGCYQGRYVPLLQAIHEAVGEDGSRGLCDFRVRRVPGSGFELRTYAPHLGTDRRRGHCESPTVFATELGNVRNPRRSVQRHAEVTVAVGGWWGGGMERTIYQEENATALAESAWRRRERFYDLRDVESPDTIPGILEQKLVEDGKLEEVTFTAVQTAGCVYGRDWGLGDLVTADLFDEVYDMRMTAVYGRISGRNEETIEGRAELWDRAAVVE